MLRVVSSSGQLIETKSERRQQFVELDLGGVALGNGLLVEERIVGQHVHVEHRRAELGDAAADIAEANDADGLVVDVVARVEIAVVHRAFAERVVGLDDLLRQHQHHGEHMRGDRVGIAAGLVDDQHAGVGAVLDVDGVVAGAAGRDDQQVRCARDQIFVDVIFRRQFVARRADLVGVGGGDDRAGGRIGRNRFRACRGGFPGRVAIRSR